MDSQPLVTVFTLVYYTKPQYVKEALDSIFNQSYKNIEHFIMNDAPEDIDCWPDIKDYIIQKNYPSTIIENAVNQGICKNLNTILDHSKGKYIIGCSDDILLKDRIKKDVSILESLTEDYALVFSPAQMIDSNSVLLPDILGYITSFPKDDNYLNILVNGNIICAPATTIRVSSLRKVGKYDENLEYEDYDMWVNLSIHNLRFKYHSEINTYYRTHSGGLSKKSQILLSGEIKMWMKYDQIKHTKKLLEKRILTSFFYFPELYNHFFNLYSQNKKPSIIFKIISLGFSSIKFLNIYHIFRFLYFSFYKKYLKKYNVL